MQHLTPAERSRKWREDHITKCAGCGRLRQIKGRGLCATCYNREWRKTPRAKEIIKKSNDARSSRRRRNGKNIWSSNLWHILAERPCELCGWKEGNRDVHHVLSQAQGGSRKAENLITLCPNHHRLAHEESVPEQILTEAIRRRGEIKEVNNVAKGEKHPQAKLTEKDIWEIRRLADESKMTITQIAAQFGIARSTASEIIHHKKWAHLA